MKEDWLELLFCALTFICGTIATIVLSKFSSKTHSYQLRACIPSIWLSLCVLFAFVSIYVSSSNEMLNLSSLASIFISTIPVLVIGILGHSLTNIYNKWEYAKYEKKDMDKFDELNRSLSKYRNVNSPQLVIFELLSSIREASSKIIGKLNTINESIEKDLASKSRNIDR